MLPVVLGIVGARQQGLPAREVPTTSRADPPQEDAESKHRRIPKRRAALAGAGVAALVAAGVTFPVCERQRACEGLRAETLSVSAAGKLASTLAKDLGADSAGTYYDTKSKNLVVNVLDEAAAKAVEKAGAKARVVANSLAELKSARGTLKADATIPGTAWVTDPTTNKVVVTADRTVSKAEWATLTKVVDGLGAKAELKRSKGEYKPFIAGGDAITGGSGRCSLGFNVVKGGEPFFLTAGHCTEGISTWSDSSGKEIGTNADSSFPDNDYGLVKYTAQAAHPSEVNLYNGSTQKISGAAEAYRRHAGHAERVDDPGARREGHGAGRHRELRQRRHRERSDPDRRLRRAW
ncbi:Streptogrisin-D [Streptomyces purpurascens]